MGVALGSNPMNFVLYVHFVQKMSKNKKDKKY